RGELRVGRNEGDLGRDDVLREGVEDYPSIIAENELADCAVRQEDRQVDIAEVEKRKDPAARPHYLSDLREFVLNAAPAGGDQRRIIDARLNPLDRSLIGLDARFRGLQTGDRRIIGGLRGFQRVSHLIKLFWRFDSLGNERAVARELLP